jgi:hypothetical protein
MEAVVKSAPRAACVLKNGAASSRVAPARSFGPMVEAVKTSTKVLANRGFHVVVEGDGGQIGLEDPFHL